MEKIDKHILETLESDYNLSKDQISKITAFVNILKKWSSTYNLIGPREMENIWGRHVLDSLQLIKYLPPIQSSPTIVDIGSGAGFPGVLLSLSGYDDVHLVEKSQKKCLFLETVSRETVAPFKVHQSRIEDLPPSLKADVLTSRALADLKSLLFYSKSLLSDSGYCLFLKGDKVDQEIQNAQKQFDFNSEKIEGTSDSSNVILKVWGIFSK